MSKYSDNLTNIQRLLQDIVQLNADIKTLSGPIQLKTMVQIVKRAYDINQYPFMIKTQIECSYQGKWITDDEYEALMAEFNKAQMLIKSFGLTLGV